jgi:hypothetical protein
MTFELFETGSDARAASRCVCTVRNGVFYDAFNGQYRPQTDDFGNTVGVRPIPAANGYHHQGFGLLYLYERLQLA